MTAKYFKKALLGALCLTAPLVMSAPSASAKPHQYIEYTEAQKAEFKRRQSLPDRYYSPMPDRPRPDATGHDAAWHAFPTAVQGDKSFKFKIKGYVFGLKMISGDYEGVIGPTIGGKGKYAVRSNLKTSGLGAVLKKLHIWGITQGHYTRDKFFPKSHIQQNLGDSGRRVELHYNDTAKSVEVGINPPVFSQGKVKPSMLERYNGTDAVTTFIDMMMRKPAEETDPTRRRTNANLCEGDINVFDSKQHYALRMERAGTKRTRFLKQRVNAIKCNVYYVPINGFDPSGLPSEEEAKTPVKVYLSYVPALDMYVPFRFSYKINAITAIIRVSDVWVDGVKVGR